MSHPETSQNEEELLCYSCYGTGWFESVHIKLWLNAISHGSQWITTKRMSKKKNNIVYAAAAFLK